MSLVTTTLSRLVAAGDSTITVAAATGLAPLRLLVVDDEWMQVSRAYVPGSLIVPVFRGVEGSSRGAHPISANVTHGEPQDFEENASQAMVTQPLHRVTRVVSYSASGAIALPKPGEDLRVILNTDDGIEMTLAAPDESINGSTVLIVAGAATSSNTVTIDAGVGGAGATSSAILFNDNGQAGVMLIAVNGEWVTLAWSGYLDDISVSIATPE